MRRDSFPSSDPFQQENGSSLSLLHTYPGYMSAFLHSINPQTVTLTNALHTPEVSHKHCFTVREISYALLYRDPVVSPGTPQWTG